LFWTWFHERRDGVSKADCQSAAAYQAAPHDACAAVFFICICGGFFFGGRLSRTLLSRIALGTDPFRILLFCSVGACLGALVAAAAPVAGIATFGIWLTGWSLAGIYPAVLGIAGIRFQSHSGTVFGILFAIALTGGMIVPWLSGQVAALAGLRWVFALVSGCFAAIVLLGRLAHQRTGSTGE
jgi:fucose permease